MTSYDFSNRNPYEDITNQILQNALPKVDPHVEQPAPPVGYLTYLKSLWYGPDPVLLKIEELKRKQSQAMNYNDWQQISLLLDELEGNDKWKLKEESSLYDYRALRAQLEELRSCRESADYERILYIIRTTWKRDIFGINNQDLYKRCHIGTKKLIRDYIDECNMCLAELVSPNCPIDDTILLDTLVQSKRNYGRTAMTMSGGGAFGLIGIGLFSTFLENDVFPKVISGSSGGSIVSSIICSKTSDEVIKILNSLFDSKFQVFSLEDDSDTLYTHLSRFLKYGVWFDSKYLQTTMQKFLGNITFKEAYNKTGRILNITVSSVSVHDQPTLLNYLTAPNVLIWSAVCASCSLPFVFPSSAIYERNSVTGEIDKWSNPSLKFVDGSINSDLPISRLSEMFNVNHVIACQVNPHITPLVKLAADCVDVSNIGIPWTLKRYLFRMGNLATQELVHYMDLLKEFGICENLAKKGKQLLMQVYSGDITILPKINSNELEKTLANPTPTFIWDCILDGAKSTWPKLSLIKDQLTLEFSMDKYISVLKSRIVFDNKEEIVPTIKGVRSSASMHSISHKKYTGKNTRPSSNSISENFRRAGARKQASTSSLRKNSYSGPSGPSGRVRISANAQIFGNDDGYDNYTPIQYRGVENESPLGNNCVDLNDSKNSEPCKGIFETYSYYDTGKDDEGDESIEYYTIPRDSHSTQSLSTLMYEPSSRKTTSKKPRYRVKSNSIQLDQQYKLVRRNAHDTPQYPGSSLHSRPKK